MMLIANSIESTKGEMSGFGGGTQLWKLLTAVWALRYRRAQNRHVLEGDAGASRNRFGSSPLPSDWRLAEALSRHAKGAVELARHVLECDQSRQLHDAIIVEIGPQVFHLLIFYFQIGSRHRLCVVKNRLFAAVKQVALPPGLESVHFIRTHAPLQKRCGVYIDTKGTRVDLRHTNGDERTECRINRRRVSVDHAIKHRHSSEQFRHSGPE